jgi:hypothetical protein
VRTTGCSRPAFEFAAARPSTAELTWHGRECRKCRDRRDERSRSDRRASPPDVMGVLPGVHSLAIDTAPDGAPSGRVGRTYACEQGIVLS